VLVVAVGAATRALKERPPLSTAMQKPLERQVTPLSDSPGSALEELHSGVELVGSPLANASPLSSTITHSPVAAQETPVGSLSTGVRLQVACEAPGSALASALPAASLATQAPDAEQETARSSLESTCRAVHAALAGSVLEITSPAPSAVPSTATHSAAEAQEMASRRRPASLLTSFHTPDFGSVLASTSPPSSTATHSDALGQETPVSTPPWVLTGEDQTTPPPATLPTTASPRPSTATQGPPDAHETALGVPPESKEVAGDQASEAAACAAGGVSEASSESEAQTVAASR
jgi:hypothetical protein